MMSWIQLAQDED